MISKYKKSGTALSKKEMKEIKGGLMPPPHYNKYFCTDGFLTGYYCSDVDPGPTCGFTCNIVATCTVKTWTGVNCF